MLDRHVSEPLRITLSRPAVFFNNNHAGIGRLPSPVGERAAQWGLRLIASRPLRDHRHMRRRIVGIVLIAAAAALFAGCADRQVDVMQTPVPPPPPNQALPSR
jgi:hypothetical protein